MINTVIYHSADYDGIFCREIARKFLPKDTALIGWTFGDLPLKIPEEGPVYVMDLPVAEVFGAKATDQMMEWPAALSPVIVRGLLERLVWIDHHVSAIASHPLGIPGYRIDGVAACRLTWQWFKAQIVWAAQTGSMSPLSPFPTKDEFVDRKVSEPLAVRLAGEYDVWDHRGDGDLEFQCGLDTRPQLDWEALLSTDEFGAEIVAELIRDGTLAMRCLAQRDARVVRERSFTRAWEGLNFLCLNTPRCSSLSFAALDKPENKHDGLLAFYFNGRHWIVSLYHAAGRKDSDLLKIARAHGGGGHAGACGFQCETLPFLEPSPVPRELSSRSTPVFSRPH